MDGGTIIQGNKINIFASSAGTNPSLDRDLSANLT